MASDLLAEGELSQKLLVKGELGASHRRAKLGALGPL